ncbi:MAG: cytochrome c family protein [Desulfuromonadales bacterium]|nr:cytochrome c family protein [Desulfuromonadales bacterium]
MKKLFALLIAVSLVSAVATLVIADSNAPAEIQYPTKLGTITFNHLSHESRTDCASCHSAVQGIEDKQRKDAFHGLCISCHKEQQQGPTSCKDCHVK